MNTKKIFIAGDFAYYIYERAVVESLQRQGFHHIEEFSFNKYFSNIIGKIERYLVFVGVCTLFMNIKFWLSVYRKSPDVVVVWRGTMVLPLTLRIIKRTTRTLLVSYNNDDPFSEFYKKNMQKVSFKSRINQRRLWKLFVKSLPYYDQNFVYREKNIEEYKKAGAKNIKMFMPYYIPSLLPEKMDVQKVYDVAFIGHFENDGRNNYIDALCKAGVNIVIFGTGWKNKLKYYKKDIFPIYEKEYYETITKTKIALVFLSKLNNDQYTRRCFEIPACGTMMLSERTPTLQEFYTENEEIVFFESVPDIVSKVLFYLEDKKYLEIGKKGEKRAKNSGYDIDTRVNQLIEQIFR